MSDRLKTAILLGLLAAAALFAGAYAYHRGEQPASPAAPTRTGPPLSLSLRVEPYVTPSGRQELMFVLTLTNRTKESRRIYRPHLDPGRLLSLSGPTGTKARLIELERYQVREDPDRSLAVLEAGETLELKVPGYVRFASGVRGIHRALGKELEKRREAIPQDLILLQTSSRLAHVLEGPGKYTVVADYRSSQEFGWEGRLRSNPIELVIRPLRRRVLTKGVVRGLGQATGPPRERGLGPATANELRGRFGLTPLRSQPFPEGEQELRIWVGGGVSGALSLYRLRATPSEVRGRVWRKAGRASFAQVPPWGRLLDTLERHRIWTLPEPPDPGGHDGRLVLVELRDGERYRCYAYRNPRREQGRDAQDLLAILKALQRVGR